MAKAESDSQTADMFIWRVDGIVLNGGVSRSE